MTANTQTLENQIQQMIEKVDSMILKIAKEKGVK
jgi:hypothetical protein